MSTHAEKGEVTASRNAAAVTQQMRNAQAAGQHGKASAAFAQRKLQKTIGNSPRAYQASVLQQVANGSKQKSTGVAKAVQRQKGLLTVPSQIKKASGPSLSANSTATCQLNKAHTAVTYGVAGAIAGALVGSAVPVIGTYIGGVVGGAVGAVYGSTSTRDTVPTSGANWDTISAASLSPEMQIGLATARGNTDAKPAPLPAWVEDTVRRGMDYAGKVAKKEVDLTNAHDVKYTDSINSANPKKVASFIKINPDKDVWVQTQVNKLMANYKSALEANVTNTIALDFKWNVDYANRDGKLPGIRGAGGYKEYYAPPAPGATGTWGKNRILHKTSAVGGHNDSWWATYDHYGFFHKVI